MKTERKRKYNLFWLIFWIFVFFPVAICYFLVKQYPEKKKIIYISGGIFLVILIAGYVVEDMPQTAQEQEADYQKIVNEMEEYKEGALNVRRGWTQIATDVLDQIKNGNSICGTFLDEAILEGKQNSQELNKLKVPTKCKKAHQWLELANTNGNSGLDTLDSVCKGYLKSEFASMGLDELSRSQGNLATFQMLLGECSQNPSITKEQTQERIEKSESEIAAEELIRNAEELRDSKEGKRGMVKTYLEEQGYTITLGPISTTTEAYVVMVSEEEVDEMHYQLYQALGSLYGAWPNKNLYSVGLDTDELSCSFSVKGNKLKKYIDKQLSDEEFMAYVTSKCE